MMKVIAVVLKEPIFWKLNNTKDTINAILEARMEKPIRGGRLVSLAISQQMYAQTEDEYSKIWSWVENYRQVTDKERIYSKFNIFDMPDIKQYIHCLCKCINKNKTLNIAPITTDEVVCYILDTYLPKVLENFVKTETT